MSWNLNSDRPIFIQIMEHIEYDIVSGALPPGAKVPSVRELARLLGGDEITEAVISNAQEMRKMATDAKN